jgi:hypothetical protein
MQATDKLEVETQNLEKQVVTLIVTNVAELKTAGDLLFSVKSFIKSKKDEMKELIKPFKDGIRGIEAKYEPHIEKAERFKSLVEGQMTGFQMAELGRRQEEERKMREAELIRLEREKEILEQKAADQNSNKVLDEAIRVEERQERLMNEPVKTSFTVKGDGASTGLKMLTDYEILNESDVPREYCSPDKGKLRRAVNDGVKEIKGIRIFEKPSIVSRA